MIQELTESTGSIGNLAIGEALVRIWNAIVNKHPPSLPALK